MRNGQVKERRWTEFTLSPPATRTGDYASISPSGRITLNTRVYESIGSPTSVGLLYDEDNETIGIRPVSRIMPNSFPVVPRNASNFWIRAQDFLKATRLDISYCIQFTAIHVEDGVLILELRHTTRVAGPRSKATR